MSRSAVDKPGGSGTRQVALAIASCSAGAWISYPGAEATAGDAGDSLSAARSPLDRRGLAEDVPGWLGGGGTAPSSGLGARDRTGYGGEEEIPC